MGLYNTMLHRPIYCIPIKERDAGVIFAVYYPTIIKQNIKIRSF